MYTHTKMVQNELTNLISYNPGKFSDSYHIERI